MKKRFVLYGVLAILSLYTGLITVRALHNPIQPATAVSSVQTQNAPQELPLTRENLLRLVNEERAKVGVAPLVIDDMLNESAQWKADDMAANGYFGHVKPGDIEANGIKYLDNLNMSAHRCVHISENLTHRTDGLTMSATQAVEGNGWMSSKPHREAMLDPKYTLTGFGLMPDGAVEHFCQTN